MKKALLYTLYGNNNYGNKLQNYAVQEILKQHDIITYTVVPKKRKNFSIKSFIKSCIKFFIPNYKKNEKMRLKNFKEFDNKINKITEIDDIDNYEYVFVGSDQVWNPNDKLSQQLVSEVNKIENNKIISFSASIAVDNIPEQYIEKYKKQFLKTNHLSVRENQGKKIIEDLTNRDDVNVIVDPTMLLPISKWESIMKKPSKMLDKKYILTYFLGDLSSDRYKEIQKYAKMNNLEIIHLLDKNSVFYLCNPSEFLWLEKNAELICTDSFHSSVFALLYNRPFIIFDREQEGLSKMNSRLDTLISKFKLKNRKFEGKITAKNINHNYIEAYKILENERRKANDFLNKALEKK